MVNDLLSMAAAGSAVFLLWLALYPLTRERFPARWHYCALKASLFFLLFPIRPCLRLLERLTIPTPSAGISPAEPLSPGAVLPAAVTPSVGTVPQLYPDAPSFSLTVEAMKLLAVLWAIGAAALLTYKLTTYIRFRHRLLRCCGGRVSPEAEAVYRACQTELGIRGRVRLLCAPHIQTPLVIGLLRPTVILPGNDFSGEELRYIFLHELTHVKHHDLWIRAAALAALAIHWYNPVAYLLARHIQTISEQSCDEWVAGSLTHQEQYAYGKTILKVAADMTAGAAEFAVPMSMRRTLERRLMHMLHPKFANTKTKLLACAAAVILLACGATAALAASVSIQSDEPKTASIQNSAESEREPTAILNAKETADDSDSSETAGAADTEMASNLEGIPTIHVSVPDEKNNTVGKPQQDAARQPSVSKEAVDDKNDTAKPGEDAIPPEPDISATGNPHPDALRGDTALILVRGGTLLPDDDPESYVVIGGICYKQYIDKNGVYRLEYRVGNLDAYHHPESLLDTLVNGEYPRNSQGETYGHDALHDYVGYGPDLHQSKGTKGEIGYTRDSDTSALPNLPADECPHEFMVPLYDFEGNTIGEFAVGCGGHFSGGMTIEEAKEALANGDI